MHTPCHFAPDAPNLRVWIAGNHAEAKQIANRHFRHAVRPPVGPIDGAVIAAGTTDEAVYFAAKVQQRLAAHGTLWILLSDSAADAAGGAALELDARLARHGFRRLEATTCRDLVCTAFVCDCKKTPGFAPPPADCDG